MDNTKTLLACFLCMAALIATCAVARANTAINTHQTKEITTQEESVEAPPIEQPAVREEPVVEPEPVQETVPVQAVPKRRDYVGDNFKRDGVYWLDGTRYTWYSSNAAYHYRTEEWTPDQSGIYRDADGFVVVASGEHGKGEVVNTPFGDGKVYDYCATAGTIDVYVNY